MKTIFIGESEFGKIILAKIVKSEYKPILIVTASSIMKNLAQKYNIPIFQWQKMTISTDLCNSLKKKGPDLIVVTEGENILLKEILKIPRYGSFFIHPSLLPRWRGPFPIQSAILEKDKKTGVTIVLMNEKIDLGPILSQRALIIEEEDTFGTLQEKLAILGANLLMETIPKWLRGMVKPLPQDESKMVYSKILTEEDGKINWRKTAQDIEREIRAFNPWPGSYTFWEKKGKLIKLKILKARVFKFPGGIPYPIGKALVVPDNEIGIQCGRGFLSGRGDFLTIERLQLEGEKEMSSDEFIQTHLGFIGTILK